MQTQTQNSQDCISSDRVEGTSVYGSDGDKIGSVDCIMIEKRSGQAREAILDVGSFLGMGGSRHAVPWQKLEYDVDKGGYRLDVTEEQLKEAPSFQESDRERTISDQRHRTAVYDYYSTPVYW
ncbi:PRC-barrel domain-containing protein [Croceicoccus bisphenolivorans]|uniref:PRC-barrel domain-containing protein n=1 Tax=Croceicoccus bisphenolivorans TaxID=1783232 RepID=UPI0009EECEC8|nr:PRC-barrel domain-containing protein [Croceicoccus bisphenolivorans]